MHLQLIIDEKTGVQQTPAGWMQPRKGFEKKRDDTYVKPRLISPGYCAVSASRTASTRIPQGSFLPDGVDKNYEKMFTGSPTPAHTSGYAG